LYDVRGSRPWRISLEEVAPSPRPSTGWRFVRASAVEPTTRTTRERASRRAPPSAGSGGPRKGTLQGIGRGILVPGCLSAGDHPHVRGREQTHRPERVEVAQHVVRQAGSARGEDREEGRSEPSGVREPRVRLERTAAAAGGARRRDQESREITIRTALVAMNRIVAASTDRLVLERSAPQAGRGA